MRASWLLLTLTCCAGPGASEKVDTGKTVETPPPPLSTLCGQTDAFRRASPRDATPAEVAGAYVKTCGMEETIALTTDLVRFPTVSANERAADGPAFAAMADYLKGWAEQHGMRFEVYGKNDAWEIHLGAGDPLVDFVMHADVVPANPAEWKSPPFEAKRDGETLYGRGTEDDKGPIAAVLVTMATLQRFGVPLPGRIRAVMGTGEEHDWDGMTAYAKEKPHAKYVISLDAGYPVVVAESGFVAWLLSAPTTSKAKKRRGCAEVTSTEIGEFLTVVPGEAKMTLAGVKRPALDSAIAKVKTDEFTFEVKEDGAALQVIVKGEAIHSSEADHGKNAFWGLSRVASALDLCPGGVATMMKVVATHLDGDHWGEKLGLQYEHPLMGKLLVTPTLLRTEGDRVVLSVNMRRPAGKTSKEFEADLDRAFAKLKKEVSKDSGAVDRPPLRRRGRHRRHQRSPGVDAARRLRQGDRREGPEGHLDPGRYLRAPLSRRGLVRPLPPRAPVQGARTRRVHRARRALAGGSDHAGRGASARLGRRDLEQGTEQSVELRRRAARSSA